MMYKIGIYIPTYVPGSEFATLVTWTGFLAILENVTKQVFN